MEALIIFPNALFEKKYLPQIGKIFIVEDPLFFKDDERIANFNRLKLVLHRASMKYYQEYLKTAEYIEYNKVKNYDFLKNYDKITIFDPVDHLLIKRLKSLNKELTILETPLFLLTNQDLDEYDKSYRHQHFYKWQLEKLKIPHIKKSHDKDNRKPIPEGTIIPNIPKSDNETKYVKEAIKYVNANFKNNYGPADLKEKFIFPVTHKTAKKWLRHFLETKLENFGDYQDAILQDNPYTFHSLLSSVINIGLLLPKDVIEETAKYYGKVKINNYEGFIRQVIGWREYMRMLYVKQYDELIKANHFENRRKLSEKWYTGETNVLPVDNAIKNAFENGYLHHIERLMIMLNFMILNRIRPQDIYKWFMEFACDSYDWVMIGNVYGMGYFSANYMSRPYISTSNYILKMSDYKSNGWTAKWDALFYRFLKENKKKLTKGASFYLRNLKNFEKKPKSEQQAILKTQFI